MASMPKNAAARLNMRLMKNRALIQRAERDGSKARDANNEDTVPLIEEGRGDVVYREERPYARSWFVVSDESGCSMV